MSRSTVTHEKLILPSNGHYATEPALVRSNGKTNGLKPHKGPLYARNAAELEAIRAKAIHIVTEDDEPVDSYYAAKLQRSIIDALVCSWTPPAHPARPNQPRTFQAVANVGIFDDLNTHGIAPDILVSLDIKVDGDLMLTHHRSYFTWEFGKPPDLVIEIVSDRRGGELSHKKARYLAMPVPYYVVHDPDLCLSKRSLQVFELRDGKYHLRKDDCLPDLGLKMILVEEEFETWPRIWLRVADLAGHTLLMGLEREQQAKAQSQQDVLARQQAEAQSRQDVLARQQAEAEIARMAAKLRELGIDPNSLR